MSENTRQQGLVQKWERYSRAAKAPKSQIITALVELSTIIARRCLRFILPSPP
ncbi:hypothetical protein NXS98_11040 [Fontisphaera persica]|uniref:hypothetical protein n=1 Tax=Fontisphaera persica TaxID=2974023 RepID=UPI0024BF7AE4|nr:hypothetical protein [Fontisphaera persica]WCJ58260.1 hypothetical protein NXS98_11040 [Fontisphaera persica]